MKSLFLHQGENAGKANAEAIWTPLLKQLTSYPGLTLSDLKYTEFKNFKGYFDDRFGAIDVAKPVAAAPMPWEEVCLPFIYSGYNTDSFSAQKTGHCGKETWSWGARYGANSKTIRKFHLFDSSYRSLTNFSLILTADCLEPVT
jgi:hypothetical protein